MIYSKFFLKDRNKFLPSLIALSLGAILFFLFFLNLINKKLPVSKANISSVLKLVIGNISSNSATVYWRSNKETTGWILYGETEDKLEKIAFDERDLINKKKLYKNHYVVLRNLKENTNYYFLLVVDNKFFKKNDQLFSFKTLSSQSEIKNVSLAYGKVVDKNADVVKEAIVNLTFDKKKYFLTTTKSSGEWVIPINIISGSPIPKEIIIEIINEKGEISSIIADIKNINPLPKTIVIGKNYNFTQAQEKVLSSINQISNSKEEIEIFYPLENGVIPASKPLIKGKALPNTNVSIIIEGKKNIFAKLKSNNSGVWNYVLPNFLPLGNYRLRLITKNKNNQEIIKERRFKIIGNTGSAVLGEATPSATIAISPNLTLTPTPLIYLSPTMEISPTITPPIPGANYNFFYYLSLVTIILGLGLILAF